jgi:hypothetical protein
MAGSDQSCWDMWRKASSSALHRYLRTACATYCSAPHTRILYNGNWEAHGTPVCAAIKCCDRNAIKQRDPAYGRPGRPRRAGDRERTGSLIHPAVSTIRVVNLHSTPCSQAIVNLFRISDKPLACRRASAGYKMGHQPPQTRAGSCGVHGRAMFQTRPYTPNDVTADAPWSGARASINFAVCVQLSGRLRRWSISLRVLKNGKDFAGTVTAAPERGCAGGWQQPYLPKPWAVQRSKRPCLRFATHLARLPPRCGRPLEQEDGNGAIARCGRL